MKKFTFFTVLVLILFSGCFEAPNVTESRGDIQKELNNRKARKISAEDEELFGLIWVEELLSDTSQPMLDSLVDQKIVEVSFFASNDSSVTEDIQLLFEAYHYELDRKQTLSVQSFHKKNAVRPYYYGAKPIIRGSDFVGITFLKIDAAEVRRNLPEQ